MKIDVNISIDTENTHDIETIEEIIELLQQLAEKMEWYEKTSFSVLCNTIFISVFRTTDSK